MAVLTPYAHIELTDEGVPTISRTTMKVIELAREQQSQRKTAKDLQETHPELTMGQIHSALAYYWDHKVELDADIK